MAAPKDYYATLGVSRGATPDEVRSAHRRLARELHPDINKSADAPERFKAVQEAYDVLSDAEQRKVYDQVGHAAYASGFRGAPAGERPGGAGGTGRARGGTYTWSNIGAEPREGQSPFTSDDIGSVFEEFFGRRPGVGAGEGESPDEPVSRTRHRARGGRGQDARAAIDIPFDVALSGGVRTIRVGRDGAGNEETIDVTIPKGIDDGAVLRLRGKGAPGRAGTPGDLLLTVRVAPHQRYTRSGLDLSADLPVSIVEAALGVKAEVETTRGRVQVSVPPGAPSGARLRLKGRGVEKPDGAVGDFYAVVKIVPPPAGSLTPEDAAALRSLAERLPRVRSD